MKRLLVWLVIVGCLGGLGGVYGWNHVKWRTPVAERYRTQKITRGDVRRLVTSSGAVQPVRSVQVGSVVSGPIQNVLVDFNSRVKTGQVMAEIDPRTFEAAVARDEATLAHSEAEVERIKALLEQATRNEERANRLRAARKTFISETEVDQYGSERKSLAAQLKVAQAAVRQAQATLRSSRTNLEFTTIKAPVDGLVIDRKVDPGQTLASQFQISTMFLVSPDLEKRIYVLASVDEADIGMIRQAEKRKQRVVFSVDAYPGDVFEGRIAQVRLNPTNVQNVVTYTVVVESPNEGLKLLPGMTANLSFQIELRENVLRVPNAALRFRPKPDEVREEDRALAESLEKEATQEPDPQIRNTRAPLVTEESVESKGRKSVWILEDDHLVAVSIEPGLADHAHTELRGDRLREGQEVVTGPRAKK